MTENSYVIVVRMFENIGWKRLSWRLSTQLWDKWPKCFSEKKNSLHPRWRLFKGQGAMTQSITCSPASLILLFLSE